MTDEISDVDEPVEITVNGPMVNSICEVKCRECSNVLVRPRSEVHVRVKANPMIKLVMVGCSCGVKYCIQSEIDGYTYA